MDHTVCNFFLNTVNLLASFTLENILMIFCKTFEQINLLGSFIDNPFILLFHLFFSDTFCTEQILFSKIWMLFPFFFTNSQITKSNLSANFNASHQQRNLQQLLISAMFLYFNSIVYCNKWIYTFITNNFSNQIWVFIQSLFHSCDPLFQNVYLYTVTASSNLVVNAVQLTLFLFCNLHYYLFHHEIYRKISEHVN